VDEPAIFTVSSSQVGWLVCEGEEIAGVLSSQQSALKTADWLAHQRHVESGLPTAVVLRYPGGAEVMAGRYD